jgi:hypothetical protein
VLAGVLGAERPSLEAAQLLLGRRVLRDDRAAVGVSRIVAGDRGGDGKGERQRGERAE